MEESLGTEFGCNGWFVYVGYVPGRKSPVLATRPEGQNCVDVHAYFCSEVEAREYLDRLTSLLGDLITDGEL